MLVDRCLMVKRRGEWLGLSQRDVREGEKFRFPAWLFAIATILAMLRILNVSVARMAAFDYLSIIIPAILAVIFFKLSANKKHVTNVVIRLEKRRETLDDSGMLLGWEQRFYLPKKDSQDEFSTHKTADCSHIVFGLIDLELPGKQETIQEVYALYFAQHDGVALPIVESCFDKMSCYQLGKKLSTFTGIPLIELGKGQPFTKEA